MQEQNDTEFEGEEVSEQISDEDIVYQINTFGADYTIDGLVKRFDRDDIYRPEFQRNFVWTHPQASRFIESILLGLPIPSVFLYREEKQQRHLIVDGLQRLTTLHAFSKGRLPHNDKVFKLTGVKSRFDGKTLDELKPQDQRRFEDAIIHAMIIQQMSPDDNSSSVFHIFERLNSGGTPLQPQEMRAAIYHGSFQRVLGQLNENQLWREIFGNEHRRAKDQELILRFLALHFEREKYQRPMKGFLNEFMRVNREIDVRRQDDFSSSFSTTIQRAHEALGEKAFRPIRIMNVAVFDAVMVAIAARPDHNAGQIADAYNRLIHNEDFMRLSTESTSNESNVFGRIKKAIQEFDATV